MGSWQNISVVKNKGLPLWLKVKNPPAMQETQVGDVDSTPGLARSPEEKTGSLLQYSLGEAHAQRSLGATVHGVTKSQTRLNNSKQQNTHTKTIQNNHRTDNYLDMWEINQASMYKDCGLEDQKMKNQSLKHV